MRLGRVTASCFVSSIASQIKLPRRRNRTKAEEALRPEETVQRTNPQLDGLFAPVLFHHKLVKLRSRTQGGKLLILH